MVSGSATSRRSSSQSRGSKSIMASLVDDAHLHVDRDDEPIMRSRRTGGNSRSDGVGACWVEGTMESGDVTSTNRVSSLRLRVGRFRSSNDTILGHLSTQAPARCGLALLLASLVCDCSTSPSSSAVAPTPTPTPPVFGCPAAPPTPSPYPPLTIPFSITFNPDPLWVGLAGPVGGRDTVVVQLDINVDATGALHGSISKVHRMLRDRDTGQILGDVIDSGPFLYFGNTPCRVYDPLLLYGHENLTSARPSFRPNDPLGFQRRPAILSVDVTIVDTSGGTWTISKSVAWELVPAPTPRSPVNTTVRQNDPASGCAFDSIHGYGLVLDLSWDPPAGDPPITHYALNVFDGAGRLLSPFPSVTFDPDTGAHRKRIVLCNAHIDAGAERGARWAVAACLGSCVVESDFGVARFDFQSCRAAGVPACQP
jgi:hypothetical protein